MLNNRKQTLKEAIILLDKNWVRLIDNSNRWRMPDKIHELV
jgi:hypothetical protein